MFQMKESIEQKRERKEQSNCYSKDSISAIGRIEWYEILADFVKGLKTKEVTDDKK
jgi:hypothetical protein